MADFSTPFGSDGERRFPDSVETSLGFPCGPADQTLFNGMFYRIEAELGSVIAEAGIEGTNTRQTLLKEAILALIEAATGGGDPTNYLLISQARSRLPIFPEILNVDGRIVVTAPATGTVRLPGGVDILHRGIFVVTTEQTDFNTDASKTYHLRWNPTDGFQLKDVAGSTYNPTTLAETNPAFDSKYDDLLIARVVTNSSNIATITNLANKNRLLLTGEMSVPFQEHELVSPSNIQNFAPVATNWGRTPRARMTAGTNLTTAVPGLSVPPEINMGARAVDRYRIGVYWQSQSTPGTSWIAYEAEA